MQVDKKPNYDHKQMAVAPKSRTGVGVKVAMVTLASLETIRSCCLATYYVVSPQHKRVV